MSRVIVVGGGAAGMMAALQAAEMGAGVTLLEGNEKLGKKVYITGKGRCNVTNACQREGFMAQVPHNPRFLYSALSAYPPSSLMEDLEAWGCPLMVERGGRVFPKSERASDVTRAFQRQLQRLGVEVRLETKAKRLLVEKNRIAGVETSLGERLAGEAVILCTGGKSYASTGSTGDGYQWLSALGHALRPLYPALVPLCAAEPWVHSLQGLSLKNVRLTLLRDAKPLFSDIGEMLFTHFGYSGPLVLSASSYMAGIPLAQVELQLDMKPGLTPKQLDDRLRREVEAGGRRQLQTMLCSLFPARLAETVPALCGLDGHKPISTLLREEREALVRVIKALPLPLSGTRPLAEAIITCGGLEVREVRPATMESKRLPGLYIAGELLDVDALTGGYNLHIAFATGYVAGKSAGTAVAL